MGRWLSCFCASGVLGFPPFRENWKPAAREIFIGSAAVMFFCGRLEWCGKMASGFLYWLVRTRARNFRMAGYFVWFVVALWIFHTKGVWKIVVECTVLCRMLFEIYVMRNSIAGFEMIWIIGKMVFTHDIRVVLCSN